MKAAEDYAAEYAPGRAPPRLVELIRRVMEDAFSMGKLEGQRELLGLVESTDRKVGSYMASLEDARLMMDPVSHV